MQLCQQFHYDLLLYAKDVCRLKKKDHFVSSQEELERSNKNGIL